jgi:2-amino-4-hydroxy-6-hydroxymethyldihydropteridine diphosphokinase
MSSCYIGLGSNIEGPRDQVIQAISELAELPSSTLSKTSSLYQSKPLGLQDQPDFINAVAELETSLSVRKLLSYLQEIESNHHRSREIHWGPRTLDLDILLYDAVEIDNADLKIPHPEIRNRNFVLIPLYEIAVELTIPGMGKLAELVRQIDPSGLDKIQVTENDNV